MELVKEAPAVVPTERPLKKQSGGLFSRVAREGESTTLAGKARVLPAAKPLLQLPCLLGVPEQTNPNLTSISDRFSCVFYI